MAAGEEGSEERVSGDGGSFEEGYGGVAVDEREDGRMREQENASSSKGILGDFLGLRLGTRCIIDWDGL
jgi:hypothetical protein